MDNAPTAAGAVLEQVRRAIFEFEDYLFEKRYRLDLGEIIKGRDLIVTNQDSRSHATAYHAVWCRNLRELFKEARKTGLCFSNFVDIGSGKGKACLYAHGRYPFKNIIGVEFSKPLIEIANRNKNRTGARNITFINADAGDYRLPKQTNLVFMFNPFGSIILEKFITNNFSHFQENDSVIAYANDTQRLSLARFGFETIFRNQTRKISLHKLP